MKPASTLGFSKYVADAWIGSELGLIWDLLAKNVIARWSDVTDVGMSAPQAIFLLQMLNSDWSRVFPLTAAVLAY